MLLMFAYDLRFPRLPATVEPLPEIDGTPSRPVQPPFGWRRSRISRRFTAKGNPPPFVPKSWVRRKKLAFAKPGL